MKTLNEFLEKFPVIKGSNQNPYIILFDSYSGMGKTTVAQEIAKYENVVILNNDAVRNFLNDYQDETGLKNLFQQYRLEKLLENYNNCILDSCLCHNYQKKLEYFNSLGYKYFVVRLECSDEVIKERLLNRTLDGINFSIATYENYLNMKKNISRVPLELIDFTINTEKNIPEQVKKLIKYINKEVRKCGN